MTKVNDDWEQEYDDDWSEFEDWDSGSWNRPEPTYVTLLNDLVPEVRDYLRNKYKELEKTNNQVEINRLGYLIQEMEVFYVKRNSRKIFG